MAAAPSPSATAAPGRAAALGWLAYEAGRTPYFVLVNIYVFAPYFASRIVGDPVRGQATWGFVTAAGAFLVALLGPVGGAAADAGGRRKPWLLAATLGALAAMSLLWWATPARGVLFAAAAVAGASALFELSVVFHNALLTRAAPPERLGALSGLSFGLGNLASLVVLGVFTFALAGPRPAFGLSHADFGPERAAGLLAAAVFALGAWPLFVWTPDAPGTGRKLGPAVAEGLRTLRGTARALGRQRNLARYLVARMIFNDGFVVILYFSGVYLGGRFGWSPGTLTTYGAIMGLAAFAGAVAGGWIDDRIGSRRTLLLAVGVVAAATVVNLTLGPTTLLGVTVAGRAAGAPELSSAPEIAAVGNGVLCTVGLLAGIASSRTMLARIAPPERLAECFGLFALSGNAMAFFAPLAVGVATALSGSQQGGLAVTLAFLLVGGALLLGVREARDADPPAPGVPA